MKKTNSEYPVHRHWFSGKGIWMLVLSFTLAAGASAQHGHVGYSAVRVYPRAFVGVGFGYGPYLPYYGFYNPWGYPYPPYYYGHGAMPSRLSLQIDDIKNDYEARIRDVKDDSALTRKDRKQQINQLKHDRDAAIIQAKRDFYYNSQKNNKAQPQPSGGSGQQPPENNDQKPSKDNSNPPVEKSNGDSGGQAVPDQTYGGTGSF